MFSMSFLLTLEDLNISTAHSRPMSVRRHHFVLARNWQFEFGNATILLRVVDFDVARRVAVLLSVDEPSESSKWIGVDFHIDDDFVAWLHGEIWHLKFSQMS